MIIVDTALQARESQGQPIRVGMIGAGFMGRGSPTRSSTASRHAHGRHLQPAPERGDRLSLRGPRALVVRRRRDLDDAIAPGIPSWRRTPCDLPLAEIDVIVDVTGSVEFGAQVLLEAFRHGKPSS
jgi:hypothetical protein